MKEILTRTSIAFIYIIVILLILEAGLRVLGFRPIKRKEHPNISRHEMDNRIGWKLKNGQYDIAVNNHGDSMKYEMVPEIGRVVRNTDTITPPSKRIYFIGGSFTFGYGVNDEETFAWKLQKRFPHFDFKNFGVGGYGTYQSLLCLENLLDKDHVPDVVIYGLIEHHKWRNVAAASWLQSMDKTAGNQGVLVPYVSLLQDGSLSRETPTKLRLIPFSEKISIISMIQHIYNRFLSFEREQNADQVLHLLISEMKALCDQYGIDFYVAPLYYPQDEIQELFKVFELNEVNYINCNIHLSEANTIKDDGHPLPEVHSYWAEIIGSRLEKDSSCKVPLNK